MGEAVDTRLSSSPPLPQLFFIRLGEPGDEAKSKGATLFTRSTLTKFTLLEKVGGFFLHVADHWYVKFL